MQKLWVILALFLSLDLCSQDHFNRIIPFEFGNPNSIELFEFEEHYLIPTLYFPLQGEAQTAVIQSDGNLKTQYHNYPDIAFAPKSLRQIEDKLFIYGKNRALAHDLQVAEVKNNWALGDVSQISTTGDWNYALASATLNDNLYQLYGYEEGTDRIFGLNKMTQNLDEVWTKNYDVNYTYGFSWGLQPTDDGNLLISYTSHDGHVMKVDSSGGVIWRSEAFDDTQGGATKVSVIELSNGNILANYRKDMWGDINFVCCYVPYTPVFVLMDSDGQRIHEKIMHIDLSENVNYANFEAGNGGYYFGYGQKIFYDDDLNEDYYGFITKFDNSGDTIWNKYYRHPDFNDANITYYINDIIENEGGGLVALGNIYPLGQKGEVWLFSVDADGCFTADNCGEEIQILTSSTQVAWDEGEVFVYPNPTSGLLHVSPSDQEEIVKVEVYTTAGQLAFSSPNSSQSIDISSLAAGTYQVRVYLESGAVASQQVVLH